MLILFVLIFLAMVLLNKSKFGNTLKVAVISSIYKPKNIETWIELNRKFGISHFYINLENTPELINYLNAQPDVTITIASPNEKNSYITQQTRQTQFVTDSLKVAKHDNIDFIIHIDSDEILKGDINEIKSLPRDTLNFWMQNYEAVYSKIPSKSDNCFQAKRYRDCSTETCASYINGKGGARIVSELGKIKPFGPHRFVVSGDQNFGVKLNKVKVLHYESCDFDNYVSKYQKYAKGADLSKIPFVYYRESIENAENLDKLKEIYTKYRVN